MTSRRLVSSVVAVTLVFLSGWVTVPSASAAPSMPEWLPMQSSRLSSSLEGIPVGFFGGGWTSVKEEDFGPVSQHKWLQNFAARGAHIPGVSDASKALKIPPTEVTRAQATEYFPGYDKLSRKPGFNSVVAAPANSNGVYTVTTAQPPQGGKAGAFSKGGKVLGTVAKGAGSAIAVAEVFNLGTSIGNGVAQLTGLKTSGSFTCDLATAFASSDCALAAGPDYAPNSDFGAQVPGWVGGKNFIDFVGKAATGQGDYRIAWDVQAPAYGARTGLVTVTAVFTGSCANPLKILGGSVGLANKANDGSVGATGSLVPVSGRPDWCAQRSTSTAVMTLNVGSTHPSSATFGSVRVVPPTSTGWDSSPVSGSQEIVWHPYGSPSRPADVDTNPQRMWIVEWMCADESSGTARSEKYSELDETWAPVPAADCGASAVTALKIWQRTPGSADLLMYEMTVPKGVTDQNKTFPKCSNGGCVLDLVTKKTGVEVSCFKSPELCVNWLTEVKDQNSTDYQCTFQGKKVAISECYIYGPSFNRAKVSKNVVYGDPKTGLDPEVTTTTDPNTDPVVVEDYDPNCPPPFSLGGLFSGWWVYQGAKCAIVETFVPKPGFVNTKIDSLRSTISARPPASIVVAGAAAASSFTAGWEGGCSSLPDFDPARQGRLRLPCSPPGGTGFNALYTLATIVLTGGTILALWHMGSATMNAQATGE